MPLTAAEIAREIEGTVEGNPSLQLHGFASADKARPGDLTFAENETYFRRAEDSAAAAILVDLPFQSPKKTIIRVPQARVAFARVLPLFYPEPVHPPGIHPTAVVHPTAIVDPTASIGPHCVVEAEVHVGPRCVLHAGCHIGYLSVLGADSQIFPRVVLYPRTQLGQRVRIHAGTVVGADGFGYVLDDGKQRKIPQAGNVLIQDDVEIGANVTIDRGALGPTVIGRGTKIDNLVQIAHNVSIGEHCLVVAQVGIAGSTKLGNYVTLAGQVGIAGHLKIGSNSVVAAQSGVMNDIPEGQKWLGSPARPDRKMKRLILAVQQLPDLLHRVSQLEARLNPNPNPNPNNTPPHA